MNIVEREGAIGQYCMRSWIGFERLDVSSVTSQILCVTLKPSPPPLLRSSSVFCERFMTSAGEKNTQKMISAAL